VISEAPFLFAVAGLSASLAGLAGLVAGLRRGADIRSLDVYRLREIVEFAFANALLSLSTIPVAVALDSTSDAVRIVAAAALAYTVVHVAVLVRRSRRFALPRSRAWVAVAVFVDLTTPILVAVCVVSGSVAAFEALLLVLLFRPMAAFLLVLESFEAT
jgi:hypothetical protein